MFAIVEDSGRQFRVQEGETIRVDFRDGAQPGQPLAFDRVLLANAGAASIIGRPAIDGASVAAEVVEPELKGTKLEIQKFRRRKNVRRHTGHRQKYTTVRITGISVPGLEAAPATPPSD